jgi:hypothetical protein
MDSDKNKISISDNKINREKISPILQFLASVGGRVVLTIVFAAIIYGVLMAALQTDNTVILGVVLIACGYFGWQSLNKITPNIFLWMPLAGWAIYFLVKGLLSIFVGAFIAPFWLGKKISSVVMEYIDVAVKEITK